MQELLLDRWAHAWQAAPFDLKRPRPRPPCCCAALIAVSVCGRARSYPCFLPFSLPLDRQPNSSFSSPPQPAGSHPRLQRSAATGPGRAAGRPGGAAGAHPAPAPAHLPHRWPTREAPEAGGVACFEFAAEACAAPTSGGAAVEVPVLGCNRLEAISTKLPPSQCTRLPTTVPRTCPPLARRRALRVLPLPVRRLRLPRLRAPLREPRRAPAGRQGWVGGVLAGRAASQALGLGVRRLQGSRSCPGSWKPTAMPARAAWQEQPGFLHAQLSSCSGP